MLNALRDFMFGGLMFPALIACFTLGELQSLHLIWKTKLFAKPQLNELKEEVMAFIS